MQKATYLDAHPRALKNAGKHQSTIVNVYNMTTTDLLHKMLQN
ncbi:MAG: hypothetical protein ACI8YO_002787, partial [Gammaproteobacteria bacterium]